MRQERTSFGKVLANCDSSFHMVLTVDRPARMFPVGHYFEFVVKTLFSSGVEAGRPRFEGLVLGFTCTEPGRLNKDTRAVTDTPLSWCVSTNGTFYANRSEIDIVAGHHMRLPVSPSADKEEAYRNLFTRPWHRRTKTETKGSVVVQWPPPPDPPEKYRQQIDWSTSLREGSTVGLLVTPHGGLVVTMGGQPVVSVPDAGVAFDRPLYPLVEAYNRVRSVQLRPEAVPPQR